jgi:hypothetical protein
MDEELQGVDVEEQPADLPEAVEPTEASELDLTGVVEESPETYQGTIESEPPGFLDRLNSAGFENVESVEDAQTRLLDAYGRAQELTDHLIDQNDHLQQQASQSSQWANYGQQWVQLQQDPNYQAYIQQQQQQYAQQQQPPQQEAWWSPPDIDQEEIGRWRHEVQDPQTGARYWDWRPDTPSEVRNGAEKYVGYVQKWNEDLTSRPQEVLPKIIREEADRVFIERMGQLYQQQQKQWGQIQQQNAVEQINSRNADWLYQNDPRTNQVMIDVQGQPVMTPEGSQVTQHVQNLRQSGMTDPNQIWTVATQLMAGEIATGLVGQHSAANKRNMEHLQRGAGHIPDRSGSVSTPNNPSPRSQNRHLSAGEKLRQQALADGLF